jgi:hypothetical protein
MDDDRQIPDVVWDDISKAADLADLLARQGRTVRFHRGAGPCGLEVELVGGGGTSVSALRAGEVADVERFAALVSRG